MVQQQTILNVADNTGAKKIMVIRVLGGSRKRFGRLGDIVVASVKEAIPNGNVKKGDVVKAVIVRTRKDLTMLFSVWDSAEQEKKQEDKTVHI